MTNKYCPWCGSVNDSTHRCPATIAMPQNISKREYFAAMAMQGILANSASVGKWSIQEGAAGACRWADELIAELNKDKP